MVTAEVPGLTVARVLTTRDAARAVPAVFGVDSGTCQLREATLTGPFFDALHSPAPTRWCSTSTGSRSTSVPRLAARAACALLTRPPVASQAEAARLGAGRPSPCCWGRGHVRRRDGAARHPHRRRASGIEDLAAAAPIVNGLLLGSTTAGRRWPDGSRTPSAAPLCWSFCLLGFAVGSLVTASATSLTVTVAGLGGGGLGAGGLVPPTVALVADLLGRARAGGCRSASSAPPRSWGRAAVGPLFGAAVLAAAASGWRGHLLADLAGALGRRRPCWTRRT